MFFAESQALGRISVIEVSAIHLTRWRHPRQTGEKQGFLDEPKAGFAQWGFGEAASWRSWSSAPVGGVRSSRVRRNLSESTGPIQAFQASYASIYIPNPAESCVQHSQKGIVCLLQCSKECVYYVLITLCNHVYYIIYIYAVYVIAFHCCTSFRPPCLDGTRKSPHTSTYRHQVAQSHLSRTQQKF